MKTRPLSHSTPDEQGTDVAVDETRHPTPAGSTDADARLRLLERLLQREGGTTERLQVLPQGRDRASFPMSFAQERLWFLHLLDPTNPAYHVVMSVPFMADLEPGTVRRAVDALVARHEGFRTAFRDLDGRPAQVVRPPAPVSLPVLDLRDVAEDDLRERLHDAVATITREPFDLPAGEVFRPTLVRLPQARSLVILAMHHVVTDGWSTGIIVRDLCALVEAAASGGPDPLPPLSVQPADFAVEQRRLFDDALGPDLAYWTSQLAGLRPLPLPLDRPRPATESGEGGGESVTLPDEVAEALKQLSREEGTTLFRTTLAAFAVLLSGITGRTDVAVGTPVTIHRDRPELAEVVGCFLNMLVLRVDVRGEPTFRELLHRVEEVCRDGFRRQHVPFEAIVRELRPERGSGSTPLFNVTFTLEQPHPTTAGWLEDRTLAEVVGVPTSAVRFDLEAHVVSTAAGLQVGISYARDLFDARTVKRWVHQLSQILHRVAKDPSVRVRALSSSPESLMSTSEFLSHLRTSDVRVWAEDGNLRVSAAPGALTPELRSELTARRDEILQALRSASRSQERIPITPRDRPVPASPAQQRLWFIEQLEAGSAAYHILSAVRTSRIDERALGRAIDLVVARHEALRTSFSSADGVPLQVVHPPVQGLLQVVDLAALPAERREDEARKVVADVATRPFDLAEAPLVRASLVHLGPGESMLGICIHHIVADQWSLEIFSKEIEAAYAALVTGRPAALPELPLQYADFAAWQHARIESGELDDQIAFWKAQLRGAPPVLELPTDRPRPPVQTMNGARRRVDLPPEVTAALRGLGRQEGVTLFMTLLAAFEVFLSRYTGQTDIVVGTPTAGRERREVEHLIGFFVNTLVLRTDLSGDPTFRELLQQVRRVVLQAHTHQEVPFDRLLDVLRPERSVAHSPLFQVMFNSPAAPVRTFRRQDGGDPEVVLGTGTSRFDLNVEVYEILENGAPPGGGGAAASALRLVFEYNTDLFEPETVERFIGSYRRLLSAVVETPDARVSHLPVISESERRKTLAEWQGVSADVPGDRRVHDLFAARAAEHPDRPAVSDASTSLTYGELDRRSRALADRLRGHGVGPEVLVGVCVDRSVDMLVAVLAVLRAGGAYVPLDPAFPSERLAFMLEDSAAPLVLTQSRLRHAVPADDARILLMDVDGGPPPADGASGPTAEAAPGNLAYVIYTSGSTGKPKGVQITHRSVVSFLAAMAHEPGLGPDDRLLALTTLSFDIAGLELFLPLAVGAHVTIASSAEAQDPLRLAERIEETDATVVQATPATWRMLLQSGWSGRTGLKMLCGGEAMERELAEQLLPMGGSLWNMYGPTEATIWCSLLRVHEGVRWPVAIGRPIANTRMYVLDAHLEPVPVGVPGELYIGGVQLARGYLNRPELTAERFVPDPFGAPGDRLYRTGDGARFRPDGTIEFLGRLDTQVKVRGFRIELGEIEYNLAELPPVAEAVVTVREDVPGDQRLVAYVVPAEGAEIAPEALQGELRKHLPAYMVPTTFVPLSSLPLTPNGKVDRKALPAPEGGAGPRTAYVAPRTDTERTIGEVWQEVLRVERVGLNENFFDLGGHSLLAVQVHARLARRLDPAPSLLDLFQYPTVAALADHVGRAEASEPLATAAAAREGEF